MNAEARAGAASALKRPRSAELRPIDPLTSTYPDLDVVDSYEIQLANIRRRVANGATGQGPQGRALVAQERCNG